MLQYFHPDNMSSAEKLKLELKRVRDEFKMSESDCGSARLQGKACSPLIVADFVQQVHATSNFNRVMNESISARELTVI